MADFAALYNRLHNRLHNRLRALLAEGPMRRRLAPRLSLPSSALLSRWAPLNFPRVLPRVFPPRLACLRLALPALLLAFALPAQAEELPEYRLKAAFLYNFAVFTEWPGEVGPVLNLCIAGRDPFGKEVDELQGKPVGERSIAVVRKAVGESLKNCQVVFLAETAVANLTKTLEELRGRPVLTVADSPGATGQNVVLNMSVVQNKVVFEANLVAARSARLNLSSKLLRLATKVQQ